MSPFKVDYTDLEAVKAFARRMGGGMTVYQHPGRRNFNITHTTRADIWGLPGCVVHFRS